MTTAIEQLRIIRNAYLSDYDGELMKYLSTGASIPVEVSTYLQELRDLPNNATPTLDEQGNLDMASVAFPNKPVGN